MMKKTTGIGFLLLAFLIACPPTEAKRKKKKTNAIAALAKDSVNADYKKVTKGAVRQQGLFTTLYNAKEGKLYLEIPDSAFSRTYLLSNRVSSTSYTREYVAGQMATNPLLISLSQDAGHVYLHNVQSSDIVSPASDPIRSSFEKNFYPPVLKGFPIVARHGKNVVIDVTAFFGANEKSISPMRPDNPVARLLGGGNNLKGTFVSDASGIVDAKSFPQNVEIKSRLTFNLSPLGQPYTLIMHRSICALPQEPMPMRRQDNRVGYFYTDKSIYSSETDGLKTRTFIHRWRLEPRPEELDDYFNGKLVEPQRPIVFYVDSAFPPKWRSAIKQGIEDWNTAFEAAGFKNAIQARDYPRNDSTFDPDDMRYSCFKYAASPTANAMGPSHVDPRTGEILTADVIWYHNITRLLHDWRFVQTAAADPSVRKLTFDDQTMQESIRYAAAHEIGHTLGLMHNMGASYAFDVDSLRDPGFTQQYGTTPSIMDYARNNYVAQPGDVERGVKLTPPILGVYDIYAINWGYRLIPGAHNPEEEKPTLDAWIAQKENDPKFEFGAQQLLSTVDPTDQTEDLGNDHIKASDYGIANLKMLMQHLQEWNMDPGERYDGMESMYLQIVAQYTRYLRHVIPYLGGIRYQEIRQGDGKEAAKHYMSRQQQFRAMQWLLGQARTYNQWLTDKELIGKLEISLNHNDKIISTIATGLINSAMLYRIEEGGLTDPRNNYTLEEYMDQLMAQLFKAPTAGQLDDAEQSLQAAAIDIMLRNSGLVQSSKATASATTSMADDEEISFPACSHAMAHDFARINYGLPTLTKDRMGALMTARLRQVLRLYNTRRAGATGPTRNFYDYQILRIERLLEN